MSLFWFFLICFIIGLLNFTQGSVPDTEDDDEE